MKRCKLLILLVLCCFIISCSAKVNVSRCEINLKQGNTDIPNEIGYFDFGNIPLYFGQIITFTIENIGDQTLKLSGEPLVLVTGTNCSEFQVFTNTTEKELSKDEQTNFRIRFMPDSMGQKTARVSIISNDKDENPYTFVIVGTCTAPAAEIHVRQDATDILSPTGNFDFGKYSVGASSDQFEFTIENNGNENLELTDTPDKIRISGTNESSFIIDENGIQSLIPGGNSTKFTIIFKPLTPGIKTAKISILNNDSDENPYTFTITGTGEAVPEINVKQGSDDLLNGIGKYKFENTLINESSNEIMFTIENLGDASLHLLNKPNFVEISGTDSAMFSVNLLTTSEYVNPSSYTTFSIMFSPTSVGVKSASISIANNDENENPYTFIIEGECVESDINVKQGNKNIADSTGVFTFFDTMVNQSTPEIEFTIENKGDGDLKLSGSPIVDISGVNASEFTLNTTSTIETINPNKDTTFTIKCNPQSLGLKTATVSIANNDLDENPYTFKINCTGVDYIKSDLNGDGLADMVVGASYNGSGGYKGGRVYIFFGKSNWNSSYDASNADVIITGDDLGDEFGFSLSIAGDINNDGLDDVVIGSHFDNDGGTKSGSVFIFFGRTTWNKNYIASDANVKLIGEDAEDEFGTAVTTGGDINNDGINDVVVGAYYDDDGGNMSGSAYVFYGRNYWNSQIDASSADIKLIGENERDYFGCEISSVGDINDDGISDLIIGAYENDEGALKAGAAYIFFGNSNWSSSIDASNANVKLIGGDADDWFGRRIATGGDVNKDGIDDVVIGAYYDDDGGDESGCAFIFFGRSNWSSKIDASNSNVRFVGEDVGDSFGRDISCTEDINCDGIDDIVIGAPHDDDGGDRSGCAFIFYGKSNWASSVDASLADVKLIGEDITDFFSSSCFTVKDINNDGVNDIVLGAWGDDDGGSNAGEAYIFFGRKKWNSSIDASNANVKLIGEEANDRFSSFNFSN